MVVAWKMGEWGDFREMRRYTMNYRAILLATFVLTVVFDLVVAVEVGLVMATSSRSSMVARMIFCRLPNRPTMRSTIWSGSRGMRDSIR